MPRLSKIGAAALAAFGWTSGSAPVTVSYLVVAGGGASGNLSSFSGGLVGGGGGAGGLLTGIASLNPTLSYTVTIGAGGTGTTNAGGNGNNSSFTGLTTAVGGGGGGEIGGNGSAGGSGGGAGGHTLLPAASGGAGTSGQGNIGGNSVANDRYGASGGGAGGAGVVANGSGTGLALSGAGTASSITGSSVTYATGGSSGYNNNAGGANTGGGGNSANTGASANGSKGGSGVVIISYVGAQQFSGGVVTSSGGNTIHTFTTSGTLGPVTPLSANYLVVAGGGGAGGRYYSGGGGAGGLLTGSALVIDPYSTYVVTVGAGGTGGASTLKGSNGTNSSFSMVATTAIGGGGGGANGAQDGLSGGSGGGGAQINLTNGAGGAGTSGQGNAGGTGAWFFSDNGDGGGGGGGASAVGGNASLQQGGAGGAGTASSISGSSVTYAGGGGGGAESGSAGAGGAGGGGAGIVGAATPANAGTANTGGGGGGIGVTTTGGGAGGSGVVIISYAGATQLMAGGVVTIAGGNVIHTFNSSGYLTPLTLFTRSLRFRSSASAYLNRTFGAGSQTTWTFSAWFKLGTLSVDRTLFSCGSGATDSIIYINSANTLFLNLDNATKRQSTLVLRDPSAWYHLVVPLDTTNGTAQNRIRAYLNGVEITAWIVNTTVALNATPSFNSAIAHNISRYIAGAGIYFDGYMAEVNFVDGQALTPSSFGTVNSYGVWQPITYGGSYGTNGFRLPFTNNASTTTLGYDFSPQGNNWTTNNISLTAGSTYDSMTDVPTLTSATAANYAVLNPLDKGTSIAVANGNLNLSIGSAVWQTIRATMAFPTTGKWYVEALLLGSGNAMVGIGAAAATLTNYAGADAFGFSYNAGGGQKFNSGSGVAYGATYAPNDIIGVAFDADAGTLTFYKNNASQGVAYSSLTNGPYFLMPSVNVSEWAINFGQRPFTYTPRSGFLALNTFNL